MSTTEFNSSELEMLAVRCERDWDVFPGERAKIIAALRKFAAIQSTPAGEVTADAVEVAIADQLDRWLELGGVMDTTLRINLAKWSKHLRALAAAFPILTQQVERSKERIKYYRARLECDHYWVAGDDGEMRRVECEDDFACDGIRCRDATIKLAEEANAALTQQVERLTLKATMLTERLSDEQEAHARLQSRCFDNSQPTHSSIFDEVAELRAERDTLSAENARLAKDAEMVNSAIGGKYIFFKERHGVGHQTTQALSQLIDFIAKKRDAATAQAKQP